MEGKKYVEDGLVNPMLYREFGRELQELLDVYFDNPEYARQFLSRFLSIDNDPQNFSDEEIAKFVPFAKYCIKRIVLYLQSKNSPVEKKNIAYYLKFVKNVVKRGVTQLDEYSSNPLVSVSDLGSLLDHDIAHMFGNVVQGKFDDRYGYTLKFGTVDYSFIDNSDLIVELFREEMWASLFDRSMFSLVEEDFDKFVSKYVSGVSGLNESDFRNIIYRKFHTDIERNFYNSKVEDLSKIAESTLPPLLLQILREIHNGRNDPLIFKKIFFKYMEPHFEYFKQHETGKRRYGVADKDKS